MSAAAQVLVVFGCATVLTIVWVFVIGASAFVDAVAEHYGSMLTMVAGAFVAGSTPLGGGVVAFPVLTLALGVDPAVARDFTLLIQSVGMNCAGVVALLLRYRLERLPLLLAFAGGVVGLALATLTIEVGVPGPWLSTLASSLYLTFAFAVFLTLRPAATAAAAAAAAAVAAAAAAGQPVAHRPRPARRFGGAMLLAGVVGGVITYLTGTGADTVAFAVSVLAFRLDVRAMQPTSVLLMGLLSLCGVASRTLASSDSGSGGSGGLHPEAVARFWAAAPVAALWAPLGLVMAANIPPAAYLALIVAGALAQYVFTAFANAASPAVLMFGFVVVAVGTLSFHAIFVTRLSGPRVGRPSPGTRDDGAAADATGVLAWIWRPAEAWRLESLAAGHLRQARSLRFLSAESEQQFLRESFSTGYGAVLQLAAYSAGALLMAAHVLHTGVCGASGCSDSAGSSADGGAQLPKPGPETLLGTTVSPGSAVLLLAAPITTFGVLLAICSHTHSAYHAPLKLCAHIAFGLHVAHVVALNATVIMAGTFALFASFSLCVSTLRVTWARSSVANLLVTIVYVTVIAADTAVPSATRFMHALAACLAFACACAGGHGEERTLRRLYAARTALMREATASRREAERTREATNELERTMAKLVAAEALRTSHRWVRAVVQGLVDPIVVCDVDDGITFCNRHSAATFGWSAAELKGRHVLDLVAPKDRPAVCSMLSKAQRGEAVPVQQVMGLRIDGSTVALDITIGSIPDITRITTSAGGGSAASSVSDHASREPSPTERHPPGRGGRLSDSSGGAAATASDGTRPPTLATGTPVNGAVAGMGVVVTFRDITAKVALIAKHEAAVAARRDFVGEYGGAHAALKQNNKELGPDEVRVRST